MLQSMGSQRVRHDLLTEQCLRWIFITWHGLSLVAVSGEQLFLVVRGLLFVEASLVWSMGSRCAGFSSCGCGLRCSAACGILLGIEPMSLTLAGGFPIHYATGKSQFSPLLKFIFESGARLIFQKSLIIKNCH